MPSVRMVLVRGHRRVGAALLHELREPEGRASSALTRTRPLAFNWPPPLRRQVRVEGRVERLAEDESRAYFRRAAAREPARRLGLRRSHARSPTATSSTPRYRDAEARFAGDEDVPLPPFWGGYRLVPQAVELWQGRPNRLHDRARYERADVGWSRVRLAP